MPIDPTQNNESADEFKAKADGDDTEGHLAAVGSEADDAPEGFRVMSADETEEGKEGFSGRW